MVAIAVVVPSFRVTDHILEVLAKIGPEVERIYVIDDACPDGFQESLSKSIPKTRGSRFCFTKPTTESVVL